MVRAQPLLDSGMTVEQAAEKLGMTKGQLSGVIYKVKNRHRPQKHVANDDNNWDRKLFEPYAERKARRCSTRPGSRATGA